MEEDITRRTAAISVQTTKFMGRASRKAFQKLLAQAEKQCRASFTSHGRQSVKRLMGHGGPSNNIRLKDDACLFDQVVRRFSVGYAFYKVGPRDCLLFFKAGQADTITTAFSEYTKRVVTRQKDRPSILGQLRQFGAHIKTRQRGREETREAAWER